MSIYIGFFRISNHRNKSETIAFDVIQILKV
jgi:hypothetical protein